MYRYFTHLNRRCSVWKKSASFQSAVMKVRWYCCLTHQLLNVRESVVENVFGQGLWAIYYHCLGGSKCRTRRRLCWQWISQLSHLGWNWLSRWNRWSSSQSTSVTATQWLLDLAFMATQQARPCWYLFHWGSPKCPVSVPWSGHSDW